MSDLKHLQANQVIRQEKASMEAETGSGEGMMAQGGSLKTGARLAVQAVIGGTLSELGGGNFANGAVTAAFAFLFNHLKHDLLSKKQAITLNNPNNDIGIWKRNIITLIGGFMHYKGQSFEIHFKGVYIYGRK